MQSKTYGFLKKRILNLLGEYDLCGECESQVNNKEDILSRLEDEVNAAQIRMYTSLPVGNKQYDTTFSYIGENEVYFTLPNDFYNFVEIFAEGKKIPVKDVYVNGDKAYILYPDFKTLTNARVVYKSKAAFVDKDTADDFEFPLSHLEFEALCNLAACYLCLANEQELYTRLICNYNDLEEAIRNGKTDKYESRQNSFYCASERVIRP